MFFAHFKSFCYFLPSFVIDFAVVGIVMCARLWFNVAISFSFSSTTVDVKNLDYVSITHTQNRREDVVKGTMFYYYLLLIAAKDVA